MSRKRGALSLRRVCACVMIFVLTAGFSVVAFANDSPDSTYATDSSNILVTAADESIDDIQSLLLGDLPSVVLGDSSLEGYSTLAVFSVSAINGYDFETPETTVIRGAAVSEDMTIQIRFLPTGGSWRKLGFSVADDALSVQFPSEGQLAIFALDDTEIEDEDATTEKAGPTDGDTSGDNTDGSNAKDNYAKSPQTGDRLPIYIGIGVLAVAIAGVSLKKIK